MQQNKTFAIRSPRQFMDKLEWDYAVLKGIDVIHSEHMSYQTINCAVTAWHMADWVFGSLSDSRRKELTGEENNIRKFRSYLQAQSEALGICREIADAAKHRLIEHKPNPLLTTEYITFVSKIDNAEVKFWYVDDGQKMHDPRKIIDQAIMFWIRFLGDENLLIRLPAAVAEQ